MAITADAQSMDLPSFVIEIRLRSAPARKIGMPLPSRNDTGRANPDLGSACPLA
jgi:hypothetical protein